jgi:hypothetical protein
MRGKSCNGLTGTYRLMKRFGAYPKNKTVVAALECYLRLGSRSAVLLIEPRSMFAFWPILP